MLNIVVSALIALVALVYYFATRKFDYWKKKNVPYLKPTPLLGNFGDLFLRKKYYGQAGQSICKQFPNEPYFGAYYGTEPALVVQDPEYVKLITTKDFYYFNGREVSEYHKKESLGVSLFSNYGDDWKVLRQNLTPVFTSAKMKSMFNLVANSSHQLEKLTDDETRLSNNVDVRLLMTKFTMSSIGSCAFGIDVNTMDTSQDCKTNPFMCVADAVLIPNLKNFYKQQFRFIWPALFYALGGILVQPTVAKFFREFMASVFKDRQYKPTSRNDLVDFILTFKSKNHLTGDSITNMKTGENKKVSIPVTDDLLVAHCLVFFMAGFETSATTSSYTLYELAKSPENLKRAQKEIDDYLLKHDNKLGYECVSELPFTEACVDETLRMYPVLGILNREVMEDYTLPTGVRLEKGLRVLLPVYHLHHNPKFFPEPEVYRPERFLGEEKKKVTPGTYLPFGDGPRLCIGMRFGKMQVLAGLVTVLKKYNLELAPGTPKKIEVTPTSAVIQPKDDLILKLTPRDGWEQRTFKQFT